MWLMLTQLQANAFVLRGRRNVTFFFYSKGKVSGLHPIRGLCVNFLSILCS